MSFQVALEIDGIRPAIISLQTRKGLEELLRFRQVVRNIYGFELDANRIEDLLILATEIYPRFTKEIEKFVAFLMAIFNGS